MHIATQTMGEGPLYDMTRTFASLNICIICSSNNPSRCKMTEILKLRVSDKVRSGEKNFTEERGERALDKEGLADLHTTRRAPTDMCRNQNLSVSCAVRIPERRQS
jgi:hypothetical protein